MTIEQDIQKLSPGKLVTMYEVDISGITGTNTVNDHLYFHNGTNELSQPVVWQGVTYQPFPIKVEGFETTTKGTLPRPSMAVANVSGILWPLMRDYDDLVGAKVIRRRTYARYLDSANFPTTNASADPSQHLPDDVYFVERKVSANKAQAVWELASVLDLQDVKLPARDVVVNFCPWDYRGPECGYTGTNYFDVTGAAVGSLAQDVCSKALTSGCKKRFSDILPFGGFPAARAYKF
jgi:lambda family phage minor tail protein L